MDALSVKNEFYVNVNLSYKTFIQRIIEHEDIKRALLNGTIIDDCEFRHVDLSLADIEGAKISNSQFKDCMAVGAIFQSTFIRYSIFVDLNFDDTTISDCTFVNCKFINCSFTRCNMTNNSFLNCEFQPIVTSSMSAENNIFDNTIFIDSEFTKHFYYSIFSECTFINSTLELYLLGYSYGINENMLSSLNLLFMGNNAIPDDITTGVIDEYTKRGLFVNIGILNINNSTYTYNEGVLLCIRMLDEYIKRDYIIKSALVKFLGYIISDLYKKKYIAPSALLSTMNMITDYMANYENISMQKIKSELTLLRNELYMKLCHFIDGLQNNLIAPMYNEMEITIEYESKPRVSLCGIINSIHENSSKVIREEHGSYIETMLTNGQAFVIVQTFLALLNVFIPFIILKKQRSIAPKHESKKSVTVINYNVNLHNAASIPDVPSKDVFLLVGNVNSLIMKEGILFMKDYMGYTEENISKITISTYEDTEEDDIDCAGNQGQYS